jgi:hypothetical protein
MEIIFALILFLSFTVGQDFTDPEGLGGLGGEIDFGGIGGYSDPTNQANPGKPANVGGSLGKGGRLGKSSRYGPTLYWGPKDGYIEYLETTVLVDDPPRPKDGRLLLWAAMANQQSRAQSSVQSHSHNLQ